MNKPFYRLKQAILSSRAAELASLLRGYFHSYDPANFSLTYALKGGCALLVVLALCFWLIDPAQIIFAIFASVFTFYMHSFSNLKLKTYYLSAFALLASLLALIIAPLVALGWLLVPIAFVWIFCVCISAGISNDLHVVGIYLTLLAMAMLISATLGRFDATAASAAVALGAGVSLLFRTIRFHSYGSFTRRSFSVVMQDLCYLCRALQTPEFEHWRSVVLARISELKTALASSSASIKDSSIIHHQELVAFYLQKCDEIATSLLALRVFCRRNPHNEHLARILREIEHNLEQLKLIFSGRTAELQTVCFKRLQAHSSMPILCDSLSVLYHKMQLFADGGASSLRIKSSANDSQINLKELAKLLNWRNKYCRYALKSALASSFALALASALQLDHGLWIAMGTFTLFKQKINETKINNTDVLIGSLIGFAIGLLLIFFFANSIMIYPLLFMSYLAAIYFRHFPQRVAMVFIMMNTAIFFCAVGLDYERLIAFRLADFAAAYAIVLAFSALWPAKSEDELRPALREFLALMSEYFGSNFSQEASCALSEQLSFIAKLQQEMKDAKNAVNQQMLLENLLAINNLSINLSNYLAAHVIGAKERNDIGIIKTRFEMLAKSSANLPAYVYQNLDDKLICSDEYVKFYCRAIFAEQTKLHEYLGS